MSADGTIPATLTSGDLAARESAGGVADFVALLKPRVMSLVVFTGLVGLMLAPGHIHPFVASVAVACIAVAAGAAGAINMWYDADIDALMTRTAGRPIPQGRIEPAEALAFGIVLSVASVVTMTLATNVAAGALLAGSIGFYVFIYTVWLKRRTPQNIVIGGAAGAFPPMIGWAAVTGDVGLGALALFAIVFMWTPPHFWALSLFAMRDYGKAGVPMLPNVAGKRETRRQIAIYSALLAPLGVAPYFCGLVGPVYAAAAAALGLVFLAGALDVWRDGLREGSDAADFAEPAAKRLFGYSIVYLFLLFGLMVLDRLPAGVLP
ncbi:MAG: protoheme IX farnesyltransferase [Alphaproteobacteria bacterium]|nr:protoheme IX farnesyltransferase [Alphaproteobacteria bacterium]